MDLQGTGLQYRTCEIAEYLDGWSYITPSDNESGTEKYHIARIKDEHGRSISMQVDHQDSNHVSCTGDMPQNEGVHVSDVHRIGFNIYREPQVLAKDIERRLLPDYIKRYDHYIDMHHKYQAHKSIVETHYNRMLKLIGDDTFGMGHVTKSSHVVYQIKGSLNGHDIIIHINDFNVALEINVPHNVADAIINLLKDREHSPGFWHHKSKM